MSHVICEQQRRRPACASAQSDQRIFAVRCLDGKISLDSIAEISRLQLGSVASQAGLSLTWSETPEDTFCRVVAHTVSYFQFDRMFSFGMIHVVFLVSRH